MSANSIQWILKSGIKSADFPDLYHAIEELRWRHPTFETIVERVHKSTFVLSAKKSVIERKECDVNHERFIDVELNMGQKKDKIELNMAGDAPADAFLALICVKDLNGPQFRVFLFNEDSPKVHRMLSRESAVFCVENEARTYSPDSDYSRSTGVLSDP
ncbi:hypothetical protein Ddc_12338 [Ditylenchus destructor]|nr:hypothetical protein Ddc_12338 [Ditylenchus destructor]